MAKKAPEQWQNRIVGYGEEAPEDLLANALNFRIHPKAQQDALLDTINEVGFVDEVIVNRRTNNMVNGHLRVTLAMRTGQASIPVKYIDVSEAEERVILATFDPISALATTDAQKLDELLHEVSTGSAAIQQMLDDMAESAGLYLDKPNGAGGDEFDATPQEGPTRTQLGDLWQLGEHRLLVGDCTIAENVERLMDGARANAVVTDPPYGIAHDTDYTRFSGSGTIDIPAEKRNTHAPITSDATPFDPSPLLGFETVILWGANCYSNRLPLGSFLVWDKRHADGTKNVLSDAEIGWLNRGHGAYIFSHVWDGVVRASERGKTLHPTQKPVALFEWCLGRVSAAAVVFDPYAGSGPCLIACERLGRKCYGCEISEKYADIVLRRWEAETGQEAVLLERVEGVS